MHQLRIYKQAEREIKKISKLHQRAIVETLNEIKENPFTGKPLTRELTGNFSYKVGSYRIIYKVNRKDKIIYVVAVGHRASIYK